MPPPLFCAAFITAAYMENLYIADPSSSFKKYGPTSRSYSTVPYRKTPPCMHTRGVFLYVWPHVCVPGRPCLVTPSDISGPPIPEGCVTYCLWKTQGLCYLEEGLPGRRKLVNEQVYLGLYYWYLPGHSSSPWETALQIISPAQHPFFVTDTLCG